MQVSWSVSVCRLEKPTSPCVELTQSISAPDLTNQKRYLIISSVQGPESRVTGISSPSETSVFRSQLQVCHTEGPSISSAKSTNPSKSRSKYSFVVFGTRDPEGLNPLLKSRYALVTSHSKQLSFSLTDWYQFARFGTVLQPNFLGLQQKIKCCPSTTQNSRLKLSTIKYIWREISQTCNTASPPLVSFSILRFLSLPCQASQVGPKAAMIVREYIVGLLSFPAMMGLARGRSRLRQQKKICCNNSVGSFSIADILRFDFRFFSDLFFISFAGSGTAASISSITTVVDGLRGLPCLNGRF